MQIVIFAGKGSTSSLKRPYCSIEFHFKEAEEKVDGTGEYQAELEL